MSFSCELSAFEWDADGSAGVISWPTQEDTAPWRFIEPKRCGAVPDLRTNRMTLFILG
jgi:hypothetical protein